MKTRIRNIDTRILQSDTQTKKIHDKNAERNPTHDFFF